MSNNLFYGHSRDDSYVEVKDIIDKLSKLGLTIGTMESCTGGLIASTITDTEGASAIFNGSFVTYSNDEKVKAGVASEVIAEHGVYSIECAKAMASAMVNIHGNSIGIGVTGTLGNIDTNNVECSTKGIVYYAIQVHSCCTDDDYWDKPKMYSGEIYVDTCKYGIRKQQKQFVCATILSYLKNVLKYY